MAEHYMEAAGIGAYVCALREAERSGATIEKYAPRAAAVRRLAGRGAR